MQNKNGFSLIEIMTAMAVGSIVLFAAYSLIVFVQKEHKKTMIQVQQRLASDVMDQNLKFNIYNMIKIEPAEKLISSKNYLYNGFHGLDALSTGKPSACRYDETGTQRYSVLRYTYLIDGSNQESLLRKWTESVSAGQTAQSDQLRTSMILDPATRLANSKEVVLIDTQTSNVRRYEINYVDKMINSDRDPNDDLPKVVAGVAQTFSYGIYFLKMPQMFDGMRDASKNLSFITGSSLYSVTTKIICVNDQDKMVEINEQDSSVKTILDPAVDGYKFKSFEIKYLSFNDNSDSTSTVATSDDKFIYYPYANEDIKPCINMIKLSFELEPLDPQIKNIIRYNRSIFLANHNKFMPAGCNTGALKFPTN